VIVFMAVRGNMDGSLLTEACGVEWRGLFPCCTAASVRAFLLRVFAGPTCSTVWLRVALRVCSREQRACKSCVFLSITITRRITGRRLDPCAGVCACVCVCADSALDAY
jgi:hypothetical protein